MARQKWTKAAARRIQERVNRVVQKRCAGQADFIRKCRFSRNTAAKWFGDEPRVPDSYSMLQIAQRMGVSLDWLLLDRGTMEWPPSSEGARQELFDSVLSRFRRERAADPLADEAAVSVLTELGADGLWDLVVNNTEEIRDLLYQLAMMERLLKKG